MSRKIPEFPTAVEVSTTDLILGWQDNATKNFPVALLQTALVPPANLVSLADVSINWGLAEGDNLTYEGGKWINKDLGLADIRASITAVSVETDNLNNRVTSVWDNAVRNISSLYDCSLEEVAEKDNFVVTYDHARSKYILTDPESGGGGLVSVDNRVTSVNNYFLNQTSVLNGRATSIDNRVSVVDGRVATVSANVTSVNTALTNLTNTVSNSTSVMGARVTSVESHVNTVSTALTNLSNTVSNSTSVMGARVTSVDNYFKNQVSIQNARTTSVENHVNTVSNAISVLSTMPANTVKARNSGTTGPSTNVSINTNSLLGRGSGVIGNITPTGRLSIVSDNLVFDESNLTTDASNVTYDNTASGLTSTDVQDAIDELVNTLGTAAYEDVRTIREIPQNSKSMDYTLVLLDAGKHIRHPPTDTTARTWTIPANSSVPFPIGTAVTFVNQNGAGVVTIACEDTMRLAGAGTTGSRTLAANGVATALKITATEWIISGTGLS